MFDLEYEYECPECGSTNLPKVSKYYENSDADGNRGIWIKYVECVDCGHEEAFSLGF